MRRKFKRAFKRFVECDFNILAFFKKPELYSGERQVAKNLDNIRSDHLARYEFTYNYILSKNKIFNYALDCFCGVGYGTYILSRCKIKNILGIDGSKDAIKFAKKNYNLSNIKYKNLTFPFSNFSEKFDAIISYESVEHINEYELFFQYLSSSLEKGGLFFVSTPNEEVLPFNKKKWPFHYKHFTKNELIDLGKRNNLIVEEIFYQSSYKDDKNYKNFDESDPLYPKKDFFGEIIILVFVKQ